MEYDLSVLNVSALIVSGLLAGFINTLAGGGTLFTLPALMLMGMPADVANGTNRVGVLLQSIAGAGGFYRHRQLDPKDILPIVSPTILGALLGAVTVSFIPVAILKPLLLGTMLVITLLIVFKPDTVEVPPDQIPLTTQEKPVALLWLFLCGFYGGFVQAGVGFVLIAALCGVLRYHLVRANALKMVCTAVFGGISVAVFTWRDQILWVPGLILAGATVVGVFFSVKFSIQASQKTLKRFLLLMVSIAILGAFIKD